MSKFSKNVKIFKNVKIVKNCQKNSKLSRLSKIVKYVKNCQNCQKSSKVVKSGQNCQKLSKNFKIFKNCQYVGQVMFSHHSDEMSQMSQWRSQILSCRQTVSGQLKSSSHQHFHQPEGSLDGALWRGLAERALERLDSSHGWVQQEVHPSSRNYQKDRSCSFWKDFKRFLTPTLSYMVRKYATK